MASSSSAAAQGGAPAQSQSQSQSANTPSQVPQLDVEVEADVCESRMGKERAKPALCTDFGRTPMPIRLWVMICEHQRTTVFYMLETSVFNGAVIAGRVSQLR